MRNYIYKYLAKYINSFAVYFDNVVQVDPLPWDNNNLKKYLKNFDADKVTSEQERKLILLNANFNYSFNIQDDLEKFYNTMNRQDRICVVLYNPYLSFVYKFANVLSLRRGELPKVFITMHDLKSLLKLTNFELVSSQNLIAFPFALLGIGNVINKLINLLPLLNTFTLLNISVLRPIKKSLAPSVSIVIPARNEKGNIEDALKRIPDLGCEREVIFVEGNSSDNTWEEIERVIQIEEYKNKFTLKAYKQPGKGKYDAVRVGFNNASNDLLVILDADLTMPPERLPQFYNAYTEGRADFINGSRLVYPMEGDAMRFLNLLGNKFFAKALSWVLTLQLGDSLCGTKLIHQRDYKKLLEWRKDFGDHDPFGDFDLLFSASVFRSAVVDIPVRYGARSYGETQINRFRDGSILLKMTILAFFKIKLKNI
jgi:hypothetical protein